MTAFVYHVDELRYLSRVFQEGLTIIFAEYHKNDGQTFLEYSAEVPKCINIIKKNNRLCSRHCSNAVWCMTCISHCSQIEVPSNSKKEFGCMEHNR